MNEQEADEFVHAVAGNWKTAPLSMQDMALCKFAEKLTHSPANMSRTDLDELRAIGFDDRAIHDATQVISYFNYINRIADALGVKPESFIQPWGR
jgi:uncharacterized peroxidase-related enzyme